MKRIFEWLDKRRPNSESPDLPDAQSESGTVKPAEIDGWAKTAGLMRQDLTGLHYNPFLKRYSMGGNTHVNYMMHLRK